jgi:subtilisin family serine protease
VVVKSFDTQPAAAAWLRGSAAAIAVVALSGTSAWAHERTLLAGVDGDEARAALESAVDELGGSVRTCSGAARLCILDFASAPPLADVRAIPGVRWVEPDVDLGATPVSPEEGPSGGPLAPGRFDDLGGTAQCPALADLSLVRADEVWSDGIDGTNGPVVAVIDTGFYAEHLDLAGRIAGQYDYGDLDDVAEVQPMVRVPAHGTFMAGIIAANPSNGVGRAGVAPYGRLFLQRVVDSRNNQDLSFTVHALTDLADNHPEVRVVAYSMIPSIISQAYEQAVAALGDRGVLFVVAAGNCGAAYCAEADNDAAPLYPQCYPYEHILAVASSDVFDQLNPWSHWGRESVDLFAPGVDVCSLGIESETAVETASGTSYSAPLVAGAAALVLEAHPGLRVVDLARVLVASAHPVPAFADLVRSGGRLDVAAAVATAVPEIAWPADLVVDGTSELRLDPVTNWGAAGDAAVVIFHGPEVSIGLAEPGGAWRADAFAAGDPIELPDVGALAAPSAGAVIAGPIGAHETSSLSLLVRGLATGRSRATVRLAIASAEGPVLSAPYSTPGSVVDASGQEAHPFAIEVTAPAQPDPPADLFDGGADEPAASGCAAAAAPARTARWAPLLSL